MQMFNNAQAKKIRGLSLKSPLKRFRERQRWCWMAILTPPFLLAPLFLLGLWYFSKGAGAVASGSGAWIMVITVATIVLGQGMGLYSAFALKRNLADFLAATQDASDEDGLRIYILALENRFAGMKPADDRAEMRKQAAQSVSVLLRQLSEDKLAQIPEEYWQRLCPSPKNTASGYFDVKNAAQNDLVQTGVFNAIRRLKRLKSLPYIETWMQHLGLSCHSDAFNIALRECYQTLVQYRDSLPDASTLLRPVAAEETAPNMLLRPASDTIRTHPETGEQLLRASAGGEADSSNNDRSL